MSLHIDTLADLVRQSIEDSDATREDWQRAIDQVFPQPQTVRVDLAIENIYADETVRDVVPGMHVPVPASYDDEVLAEWAMDELFDVTGTGRVDGDSSYVIRICGSSDPQLVGKTFEIG